MMGDSSNQAAAPQRRMLALEPYYGGSHRVALDSIVDGLRPWASTDVLTSPARHWKWRMRGSGVHFASMVDPTQRYDLIFATSYLPLSDLYAFAPSLHRVPSMLYFHENQFAYPMSRERDRAQAAFFGFSQLLASLAADALVFNSAYNRDTFLTGARALRKNLPDRLPSSWIDQIEARAEVIPVPIAFERADALTSDEALAIDAVGELPVILWSHRWDHDKRPDRLFDLLDALAAADVAFRVVICGQSSAGVPATMEAGLARHAARIAFAGFASRNGYLAWLDRADIALSTADHEFFGIAMMEAAWAGATVLAPHAQVYPELYPAACLYPDDATLHARARAVIDAVREIPIGDRDARRARGAAAIGVDVAELRGRAERYDASAVVPQIQALGGRLIRAGRRHDPGLRATPT